jgi:hypothetical protein
MCFYLQFGGRVEAPMGSLEVPCANLANGHIRLTSPGRDL